MTHSTLEKRTHDTSEDVLFSTHICQLFLRLCLKFLVVKVTQTEVVNKINKNKNWSEPLSEYVL